MGTLAGMLPWKWRLCTNKGNNISVKRLETSRIIKRYIHVKAEYYYYYYSIVKEMVWNRSEKVDHLAYKYWCVLQGSGIIKMIRNLAQSW